MESLEFNGKLGVYAQYAGETERERQRERERERNTQKNYIRKTLTQYSVHVCGFNAHVLYKSLQGLTEVLSYFNAL